ncbi:ABC transporter permease [Photobacterium rosenbergii]|uniref:ABC transporter permease n=1 Tax=Photobacterium rosenbergii TaxID=294936 RepID=A0ABU3ZH94_9GAMM|nr:ABC transporter permease [Photobacterium rosenbergii]MDV5169471.1 ABC transporter permease [Photobacterium rosenbergii]
MKSINLSPYFNALLLVTVFLIGIWAQSSGFVEQFIYYWDEIIYLSGHHIKLTLISGSIAILIGVPVGIILSRPACRKAADLVMQIFNIGTTVPTLAVLALSMSFLGIGDKPAIFALAFASVLPILRNTYTGLLSVPAHLKEAATGIGLTPTQQLVKVELPNAMYVIMAGIRTAFAINIGTVPLAFQIGGTGLGELIFAGIDLYDTPMMLAGAIPTAVLALIMDMILGVVTFLIVSKGVNPNRK